MSKRDARSFLVALVSDGLVNGAPAQTGLDASSEILDLLVELGFGLVQLPPATLALEKAAIAIDYALDQLEDYAANGYRTLWLADGRTAAETDLSARIRAECRRRGFTALKIVEAGAVSPQERARIETMLRAFAQPVAPSSIALNDAGARSSDDGL